MAALLAHRVLCHLLRRQIEAFAEHGPELIGFVQSRETEIMVNALEAVKLLDSLAGDASVLSANQDLVMREAAVNRSAIDSALHVSPGGFGDEDLYPSLVDKAAVPVVRVTRNRPRLNGNKRRGW